MKNRRGWTARCGAGTAMAAARAAGVLLVAALPAAALGACGIGPGDGAGGTAPALTLGVGSASTSSGTGPASAASAAPGTGPATTAPGVGSADATAAGPARATAAGPATSAPGAGGTGAPPETATLDADAASAAGQVARIHAIDVGQGDAVLLEFSCAAMLIDTGGELDDGFDSRAALKAYLDAFFARRTDLERTLALLVISHPHIDHMRGVPTVLDGYKVRNVIDDGLDGGSSVSKEMAALRGWLKAHASGPDAVPYRAIKRGDIKPGGLSDKIIDPIACKPVNPRIRVLWGKVSKDPGWGSDHGKPRFDNPNNHSVVTRVDFGEASMLFTGDLEERAIADLVKRSGPSGALDVDFYKVGHHGSENGTTKALLDAMTPELALLSMGPEKRHFDWSAWKFGHPRKPAVELLLGAVSGHRPPVDVPVAAAVETFAPMKIGAAIYATGWDGNVILEANADGHFKLVKNVP
jgi:competence protein ComEC